MATPKYSDQRWPDGSLFGAHRTWRATSGWRSLRSYAIILALSAPGADAADWKISPRLDLAETYTDNVTLGPSGTRQSDFVTQVSPGVSLTGTGGRLNVSANYALQNLIYADDSSRNTYNHQLGAFANAELVPQTLFLDADASIRQQITSLLGPIGLGTTNASGNLSDVRTWGIAPRLVHRFGTFASATARYDHSETSTTVSGLSRSYSDSLAANLASGSSFNDLTWGLSYSDQKSHYPNRPGIDTSKVSGTLGYRLTAKLHAFAVYGYEKSDYLFNAVEPKSDFWSAGVDWAPTSRTLLNASYGERYFGKTQAVNFSHHTRNTVWSLGYTQDVTTTQSQGAVPAVVSVEEYLLQKNQAALAAQFPNEAARRQYVEDYMAAQGFPLYLSDPISFLTNQVFLSKRLDASVGITAPKSSLVFTAYRVARESQENQATSCLLLGCGDFALSSNITQYGTSASWQWRFGARTSSSITAGWTRSSFTSENREDTLRYLTAGVTQTVNPKISGGINLRHQERETSQPGNDSRENAVTARLSLAL